MISLYSIALVVVTLATILSRRTMYAILYLILLFALIAIFVLSLGIDFIGLIFIIVYVGAIATLFLFIIMMLGGESWSSDPALDLNSHQLLLGSGYRSS
jgi:NADH-ubiquinone oxidoreductase chain 6